MDTATLKFALKISRNMRLEFEESVNNPDYCEHGTYLRTDCDNICGPCEMGYTMSDPMQRYSAALAEAKERMEKMTKLGIHAIQIRRLVPGINIDSIIDEISRLRDL